MQLTIIKARSILESNIMRTIFQKRGVRAKKCLKRAKKGKIFEKLGENVQNLKIFLKMVGDCM